MHVRHAMCRRAGALVKNRKLARLINSGSLAAGAVQVDPSVFSRDRSDTYRSAFRFPGVHRLSVSSSLFLPLSLSLSLSLSVFSSLSLPVSVPRRLLIKYYYYLTNGAITAWHRKPFSPSSAGTFPKSRKFRRRERSRKATAWLPLARKRNI